MPSNSVTISHFQKNMAVSRHFSLTSTSHLAVSTLTASGPKLPHVKHPANVDVSDPGTTEPVKARTLKDRIAKQGS